MSDLQSSNALNRRDFAAISSAALVSLVVPSRLLASEIGTKPIEKISPEVIKNALLATVQLEITIEGSKSNGSAVMVQTPDAFKDLLLNNEIMLVSACHNFWNFADGHEVEARAFFDHSESGHPAKYRSFSTRLIARFREKSINLDGQFADYSVLAMQVSPDDVRGRELLQRPVAMAAINSSLETGETVFATGCPGTSKEDFKSGISRRNPATDPVVAPRHRVGQVISISEHSTDTIFGRIEY
jgi:hypothetical protein